MQFDVNNLHCNMRDDGWLDSFKPHWSWRKWGCQKQIFSKAVLHVLNKETIKWEGNNLWLGILNFCPLCENALWCGQSEMPIDILKLGQVCGGTWLPLSIMAIRLISTRMDWGFIVRPFETRQNHGLNNCVAFTNSVMRGLQYSRVIAWTKFLTIVCTSADLGITWLLAPHSPPSLALKT